MSLSFILLGNNFAQTEILDSCETKSLTKIPLFLLMHMGLLLYILQTLINKNQVPMQKTPIIRIQENTQQDYITKQSWIY